MDERTLNDLLECSVCLERLDTSSKVLPCQHTFCRKCLEVILSSRQELRCPECRILVEIKIDDLPPNVLLMRILEGMKNTAAAAKTQLQGQQQQQETCENQKDNKIENTIKSNEDQQQLKLKQQQQFLYYQQQQQQNKQKQSQLLAVQQQQQQQQQQQNDAANAGCTANVLTSTAAATHQRRFVPHAYALYDFDSNEPSDLHFKKGEIILLKRKVDINWFVGELNGVEGTFPANYVQVMLPLPSPQCIAMYDFKMGPNEEEGCLTFKKGTVIHVLRRVDHNWAEGRIGSIIGIFPIAFVQLNPLAKQLLDSFVVLSSQQAQQQRRHQLEQQQHEQNISLQIPINQNTNTVNNINNLQQQEPPRNLPPVPAAAAKDSNNTDAVNTPTETPTTSNTSSSSSQISPNYNSNTSCSSTSSSLPSSPNESNPTSPQNSCNVRYRRDAKEKRHSLNALLSQASGGVPSASGPLLSTVQAANRHSAEILSVPSELSTLQNIRMRSANDISAAGSLKATSESTTSSEQQPTKFGERIAALTPRANVLKTAGQQSVPPTLPWGYLALYPYKPRKSDELELKKGCVYVVIERCLDGWFKGKNWQDIAGVFPGNYVTPLRNRDQQQLMHQWKYVQSQAPIQQQQQQQQLPLSASGKNKNTAAVSTCIVHQPPELPPRHSPSSSPIVPSSTNCNSSVWSKPLGHTVEAFFSRKSHNTPNDHEHDAVQVGCGGGGGGSVKDKDRDKHKDANNTASTSGCSGSASSAAVSLMKRLTHIKNRSKSPNNNNNNAAPSATIAAASIQQSATTSTNIAGKATYSMDNPSFEDSLVALGMSHKNQQQTTHAINPIHVRSGSCPSQLQQGLPVDMHAASTSTDQVSQTQQIPLQDAIYSSGSQRIKGCKERSQLATNGRPSADLAIRGVFNNIAPPPPAAAAPAPQQHQKYTKCAQQAQQQQQQHEAAACGFNNTSATIQHRKSQSLDANTISTQIKQSNTKNTMESGRGAPTTAAPNVRECRFRCVVSYPPNSEHELDLRVGDVVYVHRKQKNGWYKGTHARTNKTGLFPASFVEPDI